MTFQTGDIVKKGDILVTLDSKIVNSKIEQQNIEIKIAQLDLENSKKDYERNQKLIKKNSISQKTFDDSLFKYNSSIQNLNIAKNILDQLKIEKGYKTIKAPYDGIIIEKNTQTSQWLNIGQTIATIVDTKSADVIFNLPSSYVYKLNKDKTYNIKIKDKLFSSKLYAAIPNGDKRTRTFPIKFTLDTDGIFLYDGIDVSVKLPRDKEVNSLIVPRDAVIKRFNQDIVFIDNDGIASMIPVKIIGYNSTDVAISGAGLVEGANVVVKGNERIFPNQPIKSLDK